MFAACKKMFPDTWHINCFERLACINVLKHEKCLHSGVDMDEIVKDLADIGNSKDNCHCLEALALFKENHKLQKMFLKVLQVEHLEPCGRC